MDDSFKSDVDKLFDLASLAGNNNNITVDDIKLGEQAKVDLLANKTAPFYKCMVLFSTGIFLTKRAAELLVAFKADEAHGKALGALTERLEKLLVTEEQCLEASESQPFVSLPQGILIEAKELCASLVHLTANGSKKFHAVNKPALNAATGKLSGLADMVIVAHKKWASNKIELLSQEISSLLEIVAKGGVENAGTASVATSSNLSEDMGAACAVPEGCAQLQVKFSDWSSMCINIGTLSLDTFTLESWGSAHVQAFCLAQRKLQLATSEVASEMAWVVSLLDHKSPCSLNDGHQLLEAMSVVNELAKCEAFSSKVWGRLVNKVREEAVWAIDGGFRVVHQLCGPMERPKGR